jgi:hypothetical protein
MHKSQDFFEITTKTGPLLHYLNLRNIQTPKHASIDQMKHIKNKILSNWFQDNGDPLYSTDTPCLTNNNFEVQLSKALPVNPQELAITIVIVAMCSSEAIILFVYFRST